MPLDLLLVFIAMGDDVLVLDGILQTLVILISLQKIIYTQLTMKLNIGWDENDTIMSAIRF